MIHDQVEPTSISVSEANDAVPQAIIGDSFAIAEEIVVEVSCREGLLGSPVTLALTIFCHLRPLCSRWLESGRSHLVAIVAANNTTRYRLNPAQRADYELIHIVCGIPTSHVSLDDERTCQAVGTGRSIGV